MTQAQAETIIANLTKSHKLFRLRGYQCQPDGSLFITFERIPRSLDTIGDWIVMAGGVAGRCGIEGTGDNEVMYAVIRR